MSSPTSNVFQLPLAARTCDQCVFFEVRSDEDDDNDLCYSYCVEWGESLDDETVAASCEDFQLVLPYVAPSDPNTNRRRTL